MSNPLAGTPITSFEARVRLDWNNDGTYEDTVTRSRLKSIEIEYGRSVASALFGAANIPRCRVVAESNDNRYVPWNPSSPLYPNVSSGARVIVDILVNGTPTTLFTGRVARVTPELARPTKVVLECEGNMSILARTFPRFSPYSKQFVPTVISNILSTIPGISYTVDSSTGAAEVMHFAAEGTKSTLDIIRELERIDDGFFTEMPNGTLRYFGKRPPSLPSTPTIMLDDTPNTLGAATHIYKSLNFVDETLVTRAPYGGIYESRYKVRQLFEYAKPFALAPQEMRDFEFDVPEGLLWSVTNVIIEGSAPSYTVSVPYNDGIRAILRVKNTSSSEMLLANRLTAFGYVLLKLTKRDVVENSTAINRVGYRETQFNVDIVPYYTAKSRAEFLTTKYASPYPILEVEFDGLINKEHAELPANMKQNDFVYVASRLFGTSVMVCCVEGFRVSIGNNASYSITYTLTKYVNETANTWVLGSNALGSQTRLWY